MVKCFKIDQAGLFRPSALWFSHLLCASPKRFAQRCESGLVGGQRGTFKDHIWQRGLKHFYGTKHEVVTYIWWLVDVFDGLWNQRIEQDFKNQTQWFYYQQWWYHGCMMVDRWWNGVINIINLPCFLGMILLPTIEIPINLSVFPSDWMGWRYFSWLM